MKKRDLTKLALMGVAIGLCGGQLPAEEMECGCVDEQYLAQSGCGGYAQRGYPQGGYQQQPQPGSVQQGTPPNNYPVYPNAGGKTGKGVPISQARPPEDHPAGERPNQQQGGQGGQSNQQYQGGQPNQQYQGGQSNQQYQGGQPNQQYQGGQPNQQYQNQGNQGQGCSRY